MTNSEYIDAYFNSELSPEEIKKFDDKIITDPEFAEEVAFYYSAMTAIKNQVADEKKQRFRELYKENNDINSRPLRRLWPYVAAAASIGIIVLGIYFLGASSTPKQMADSYLRRQLKQMNVNMGAEGSMQNGKNLYNTGKFAEALNQFENILKIDTGNIEARKNAGIVSLKLQQYDQALEFFIQIENTSLFSNPGKFYHALTLMERDKPGDKQKARILLEEVVQQNDQEKEIVEEWLKKW